MSHQSARFATLNFLQHHFTLVNIKFKIHLASYLTDIKEKLCLFLQKGFGRRGDQVDNCSVRL